MGAAQQVDDEVAGAGGGVDDGDAFIAELLAKFGFEHFFDGRAHEVDDFVGGVDDAVGVGNFDAVALKEALVDGVDEGLLVAEIEGVGGFLDGFVEVVERAVEFAGVGGNGAMRTWVNAWILLAMTLVWEKKGLLKTRRIIGSVMRCWMSISSTASMLILGLSDVRQSCMNSSNLCWNSGFSLWAASILSLSWVAISRICSP